MSIRYCIPKFIIRSTILVSKIETASISLFQIGKRENKMDQSVQRLLMNCQRLQNKFW